MSFDKLSQSLVTLLDYGTVNPKKFRGVNFLECAVMYARMRDLVSRWGEVVKRHFLRQLFFRATVCSFKLTMHFLRYCSL